MGCQLRRWFLGARLSQFFQVAFGFVGFPGEGGGSAPEAGGGWRQVGCVGLGGGVGGLDAEYGEAAGEAEFGLGLRVVETYPLGNKPRIVRTIDRGWHGFRCGKIQVRS